MLSRLLKGTSPGKLQVVKKYTNERLRETWARVGTLLFFVVSWRFLLVQRSRCARRLPFGVLLCRCTWDSLRFSLVDDFLSIMLLDVEPHKKL